MKEEKKWTAGNKLTCGILLAVYAVFLLLFILPVMNMARNKSLQTTCTSNQKEIALAIQMYAQEHDGIMPSTANFWSVVAADGANSKILHCPKDKRNVKNSYGQNSSINGLKLADIINPEDTFFTAEATPESKNILSFNSGAARHSDGIIASYADGHVVYHKNNPTIFVYASTKLTKDLPANDIYTPNGKYNSAYWSLNKLDGDHKVLKNDKRSKLSYDSKNDIVTVLTIGKNASAVAKVDLPAFYPKDINEANKYWVFSADISFKKSIEAQRLVNVAIIFLDEQEKVIAAFCVFRKFEDNILWEILTLNYNNNNAFPNIEKRITAPTISLYDKTTQSMHGDLSSELAYFTPLSIAAHNDTIYVQYGDSYKFSGKAKIDLSKANWKKPTTLKIVCFENDLDGAANAIELQSPRFVIK